MIARLAEILVAQHGVLTRQQARAAGVPSSTIQSLVQTGQWQRLARGVYAAFSGPVPRVARVWAAVLAAGDGAVLSHHTAAELDGLVDEPTDPIHVTVPSRRRTVAPPGVHHHRSDAVDRARHPSCRPPRTRIEDTVLDLADAAHDADQAVGWVLRACARRLTTAARLREAMAGRGRLRRRAVLSAAVHDAGAGCQSLLELAYLRKVERAHRLPTGERQRARARRGGRWYDDVRYGAFDTIVELDGNLAHPPQDARRDARRDNAGAVAGLTILRYGFDDVVGHPCQVARQVAAVLRHHGWPGHALPCGPSCTILEG